MRKKQSTNLGSDEIISKKAAKRQKFYVKYWFKVDYTLWESILQHPCIPIKKDNNYEEKQQKVSNKQLVN